jgi:hypothetical protein
MLGMFTVSEVTGRDKYAPAPVWVRAGDDVVATLEDPCAPLTALALTADGGRVLTASWDGTVAVHCVADGVLEWRLPVDGAAPHPSPAGGRPARGSTRSPRRTPRSPRDGGHLG